MLEKPYPTRKGIAISPLELTLPASRLDISKLENWNNHHTEYTAHAFGQFCLYSIFRRLDCNQIPLPIDVHSFIHEYFAPPIFPTPKQALEAIHHAKHRGEYLKTGACLAPSFRRIDDKIIKQVEADYKKLKKIY